MQMIQQFMQFISTHSLTRRLTKKLANMLERWDISTHSLTRRLTTSDQAISVANAFQLTASQGG